MTSSGVPWKGNLAPLESLAGEVASPVYGVCSNPFRDREFKTVRDDGT